MTTPQLIYAIQEQNSSSGAWELTGHFFTKDKEAYAYVDKKNLESVIGLIDDGNARKKLAKWTETDFEEVKEMDGGEVSELLKTIPTGLIGEFADELQCGGFFSYEVLGNYDGKSPE